MTDGGTPVRVGSITRSFGYAAPPWRVFEALTEEIDGWWCHRSEPDSTISLEGAVEGALIEEGRNGTRVLGRVSAFERPRLVRLKGQLLLPESIASVVIFQVGGGIGAELVVTHEWRGDRLVKPSALRHTWGELLGGCLREHVDAGSWDVGATWGAKYPMPSAVVE